MKLSARNVLEGKVVRVTKGAVNGIVELDCGGTKIKSDITNEAIDNLGLTEGSDAYAVIKATNVMIATGNEGVKNLSARNQLSGVIAGVTKGAVNGHVTIKINNSDASVKASITNDAIEDLNLKEGNPATAVIKATDVMIGTD